MAEFPTKNKQTTNKTQPTEDSHCQTIKDSGTRTHLQEDLSYSWAAWSCGEFLNYTQKSYNILIYWKFLIVI